MKKSAAKKAVVKTKKLPDITDFITQQEEDGEMEEGGKIAQILALYIKGYSRVDIVKAGYNRSTVYRQTAEYNKMKKAPVLSYYGYDMYEARIAKIMKAKGITRDKAVELIAKKDLES